MFKRYRSLGQLDECVNPGFRFRDAYYKKMKVAHAALAVERYRLSG